jgi:crossover junction endodeoxyribonuclease RuvC
VSVADGRTIILGVDPGTRVTGWGVILLDPAGPRALAWGVIAPGAKLPIEQRLAGIFLGLRDIIAEHAPAVVALEDPFVGANVRSALAIGEARTAAMLAATLVGIPIRHYAPARVKQVVAGNGRGDKAQVREMLRLQLGLEAAPDDLNASDALAVALCHASAHEAERLIAASGG